MLTKIIRLTALTTAIVLANSAHAAATWTKVSMSVLACPSGYIPVSTYALPSGAVVPQFCVMKYEAKKNPSTAGDRSIGGSGALPVSVAAGTPWVNLTWQDARSACAAAGTQLITENQWLSLAHQTSLVASNWSGGAVGNGFMFSGHNDNAPANALEADTNDANGYINTGDSAVSPGDSAYTNYPSNVPQAYQGQRRTLTLPNGQVIWDLAGNVWEYTDATIAAASRYQGGTGQWMSYNTSEGGLVLAGNVPLDKKPLNGWNANQGMGRYYDGYQASGAYNTISEAPDNAGIGYVAPTAAFLRGGGWGDGASTGVFALDLNGGRSYAFTDVGFRCTR